MRKFNYYLKYFRISSAVCLKIRLLLVIIRPESEKTEVFALLDAKLLGNNIRELRKKRGLTQQDFAEALGVSFQAVSNWERGIAPPDLGNALAIASYFDVMLDDLFRPESQDLYLGIDGGGTKTEFAVVTSEGYVLKRIIMGRCNPNDIGLQRTLELLTRGIDEVLLDCPSIKAAFLGIAGASSGDYAKRLSHELKKRYPKIAMDIKNDAQNLFAIDDSIDMAIISGTGSVLFVRQGDGYKRLGGWGHLIDEGGSAYDIGRDALRVALAEEDMMAPPSLISALLYQKLNTATVWEHIGTVYKEGKPYVALLSSVVFDAYKMGDETAARIIDRNAKTLAELLNKCISLYGTRPVAIASGGIFTHHGDVMARFIGKYSDVKLEVTDFAPVFGACKRACALGSAQIKEDFADNFKKTYGGVKE